MGPITGFRVINLRVHDGGLDKVAYPDLTIDIGTGDHVVIGLENGGGKGTLLGFLLHVFLPDARLFLPRLAQRRQRRQGEEKRIEHYVPGGRLPTHVVVELELPAQDLRRSGQPRRALAGACLYKPNGGSPSEPSKEFFWSARCVTSELTLASLGLRSETGRLLDHREWRAWLDGMRTARPDAEIIIHDGDANWGNHLRNTLKVDVEFVKSWLLAKFAARGPLCRTWRRYDAPRPSSPGYPALQPACPNPAPSFRPASFRQPLICSPFDL